MAVTTVRFMLTVNYSVLTVKIHTKHTEFVMIKRFNR